MSIGPITDAQARVVTDPAYEDDGLELPTMIAQERADDVAYVVISALFERALRELEEPLDTRTLPE
jgi:hypothetical protein